jgi:hypothetical protein
MADATATARRVGHAPDTVSVMGLMIGGGAIIVTVLIAIGVAFLLVHGFAPARLKGRVAAEPTAPPRIDAPLTLQDDPAVDLQRFRARKYAWRDGYGWVDRDKGIVHIPIEQAMKLLVEQQGKAAR